MRVEVLKTLENIAEQDDRVVFITGDLGFGVVDSFFRRFPDRAFNAGVAEQNMVAMACGMAESGLIPFVYSIAPFATLRPLEFIRNGAVVPGARVRVIGVGGGLEYSNNGPSHFGLEDVGVLRILPGMTVLCPNDSEQAAVIVDATYRDEGPIYYRLSKNTVAAIPGRSNWDGSGIDTLQRGDGSVAVLALGALARELPVVVDRLERDGIRPTAVCVSKVSPTPEAAIRTILGEHSLVVTMEAHFFSGGLGSMVSEIAAAEPRAALVSRVGVERWPVGVTGSLEYMHRWAGIDGETVAGRVRALLAAARDRR